MTSQSSSTKCGSLALLLNTLKRRWTTGLLISLIMFFSLPVPILMYISSEVSWFERNQGTYYGDGGGASTITLGEHLMRGLGDWSEAIRMIMIPIVSVLAVVMSCIMLRYLHSRMSVDFYHSLPMKRERLLTVNLAAGYILLAIPFLAMLAVTALIIAGNGAMSTAIFVNLLHVLSEAITYSLVFYALASLIGVLTGVTAVQLLLTAVAVFIIPALYAASVLFASIFSENMWIDYYFEPELLKKLSPVLDFLADEFARLELRQYFTYLGTAALLLLATYAVYRRFRSERAGMTMIFPTLGSVIKYTLMVLMTVCGGLLFYAILESFVWTVFGMICGAVLTFMLVNTVINKSAKAMFLGLKGLGIFAGASTLVMAVLLSNLFGINTNVPKHAAKIEASFGNITDLIEFEDDAAIEALTKLYTESEWSYRRGYGQAYIRTDGYESVAYLTEKGGYSVPQNRLKLNIVFHPHLGLPIAKTVTVTNLHEFEAEMRAILDSEAFAEGYRELFTEKLDERYLNNAMWNYSGFNFDETANGLAMTQYRDEELFVNGLLPALEKDLANIGYDSFQAPVIAYTRVYTSEGNGDLNITTKMPELCELIKKTGFTNLSADEIIPALAKAIKTVKVIRIDDEKVRTFRADGEKLAILESLDALTLEDYERCELTLREPEYIVTYGFEFSEASSLRSTEYSAAFRLGQIPDFVTAAFE